MPRLIIGFIIIVLMYLGVKEYLKLRARGKAEEELGKVKAEEDAVAIQEQVELRRQKLEEKKKGPHLIADENKTMEGKEN